MRWALVCGAKGGAKTSMVQAVLDELSAREVKVAGFRQVRAGDESALVRLTTGERLMLARTPGTPRENEELFCSRIFLLEGFVRAKAWLEADGAGADVWVVDEVSKLEAAKRGHHAALEWAFANAGSRPIVLGVRQDQLFDVMTTLGLDEPIAALEGAADAEALKTFVAAISPAGAAR